MTTKPNTDKETKLKPERKTELSPSFSPSSPLPFLPSPPDLTNHSQKTKTHFSPSHFLHTLFIENPNSNPVTLISSLSSQLQVFRTLVTVTAMTQLFRSKTCGLGGRSSSVFDSAPSSPNEVEKEEEEEEEEEEEMDDDDDDDDDEYYVANPISTPLIVPEKSRERGGERQQNQQFQILAIMVAALRKSLMTCGVEKEDICSMDISPPTNVKHVSHVTFDRFNGFLGLPVEFQPKIPRRVPSASTRVFGVSAESMKCSYDDRGNSVPTILLMMQRRLYLEGGLQTEGIFRINAENSQEEYVRDQLNRGVVQHGIDVHCLAGLIKAWFRELPTGVLDSLTPDQVVNCNTEVDCVQLVTLLQPTEAALLDWAINLMADVVQHENHNKMNARNIAMVFAPNMTQMADPLTALIHAVQVMNFIKTLIIKTIRERDELSVKPSEMSSCSVSSNNIDDPNSATLANGTSEEFIKQTSNYCVHDSPVSGIFLRSITRNRLESDAEESSWNFHKSGDDHKSISGNSTPINNTMRSTEETRDGYSRDTGEGFLDRLSLRKGVRKLRNHPVFQLSKPVKKPADLGVLNTVGGGETWT